MTYNPVLRQRKLAVIFDMDGIIVDSAPCHFAAWQSTWQKRGVSYTPEDFKHNFGKRSDTQVRAIIGDAISQEEVQIIVREKDALLREIIKNNVKAFPGALELIKSLREHDCKIAVGSSSPQETVELIMKALGVDRYLDASVTGSEVTEGKPSPQIFLLAAQKLAAAPSKCVVVEDAVVGITAAKKGGMYALAVTNTHPRESFREADIVVDSLEEVTVQTLENLVAAGTGDLRVKL